MRCGADTGKGGGGVRKTVNYFTHVCTMFFPLYEVWGTPKKGSS